MIDTDKKKLKSLVESLRKTLKEEIFKTLYERFLFQIKDKTRRQLSLEAKYELEKLTEYVASLGKDLNDRNSLDAILDDLIRKKSYTFINRLFFLKSQEASGNLKVNGLTGFDKNSEYILFRELCPELCQETDEGWTYFIESLSSPFLETLPGLFADNDILSLIPIPGRAIKEALRKIDNEDYKELWKKESGATHDTLLGWLYQYWNDPDREQVNNKVIGKGVAKGKVEANEISFATQLYTEEYMVEWLVQNSIGTQWMAICKKNRPHPGSATPLPDGRGANSDNSLDLERIGVREKEFWKYYIDSEITEEMIANAPNSIYEIRVIDPACGSGHFLIYVFNFLLYLAELEDESRGIERSKSERAKLILENCIYGIDIDPRAVQITAASLYQRMVEYCRDDAGGIGVQRHRKDLINQVPTMGLPTTTVGRINIVSTDIQLWENTNHPETQELRNKFIQILKEEYKLNGGIAEKFWKVLAGAAYMGSLLQPKEELDKLLQDAMEKNILFVVGNGRDRSIHGLLDNLYNRFKQIVAEHDTFEDLGIKNLAEQMSKGARLLEILELKYHVVVANPPYLSQSKVDGELLKLFKNNSSELYESFIYTFQTKLTPSGFMGFLVSHNFMFISKFEALRKSLLDNGNIYKLAQLGTATFEDVSNTNALGFAMFVWQEGNSSNTGTYLRIGTGNYLKDQNKDKAKLLQEQYRKFVVPKSSFSEIPGYPLIYWWTEEFRETYKNAKKISEIALIKQGLISGDINRYLRSVWEVSLSDISLFKDETKKFFPYLKGADGRRWFDDAKDIIQYSNNGREFDLNNSSRHQNSDSYFIQSIAFSKIGTSDFLGRLQRYKSIFSEAASSIFIDNPEETLISLSSSIPAFVSTSLNPTINTTNSDVQKLPIFPVPHWEDYFHRAKSLYDHYFSLKETCIEYCYTGDTAGKDASSYSIFAPELAEFHHFEFLHQAKELELRSEIDKVVYEQFSEETQNAIKEEVRESVGMYPEWDQEELERFIYDNNWKVIRDAHLEVNTDHPKGPIIFNEKVVEKIIHSINQYASETVNFSIDAALIDRLGEELVGKSETAVSELIKNAYDADATKVEVYFSDLDDPSRSMLRILDNGEGMSRETLVNGFLRIASPNKVYNPNSPKFNRKRAGKKGIGRFATQRLGQNLLIRTQRAEENNGWELSINWNDFTRGKELTQIASLLRSVPKLSSSGTELVIERLKDEWDERTIKRILNSIASILHPKLRIVHDDQKEDVFFVKFFVFKDGELTSLEDEIQEDFLKYSTAVFEGGIDKNNQGYVKISTTLKSNTMLPIFDDVISFPYQKETLVDKSTEKVKSNDNATVETDETDDTNPSNEIIKDNRNLSKQSSNFEIKSKVYFKAYYFIIEEDVKANRLIRKALSEYTRSNGGIKLYRNGFKVSPYGSEGNDWLQLDERASRRLVKAPFSNRNFVGYVEIENDIANEFNETSSREGLIENEVFEQLRYLLKESLKLAVLRVKSAREQLNPKKEVEDIYKRIREIKTHLRGEKPSIDLVYLRNSFSELEIILKAKNKLLLEELDYRRILASMGLLIGYYVHDIKQYVHTMISQIRALKNMYKDDIFSSFEKNLTIFDNYTAYFDSTISQNVRRELKPIDLRTVVMEFKQTIQYDLDKFNLEVEYDFQGIKLITCAMHPSEWSSILFNFYTNARKAIYAARRPKGKILIRCGKSEGRVYLEFHDNGNGIPEEKRQWIFREGYTTSKAVEYGKKDPMAGSGLGLKIVHEIIDSYDGTIAAIDSNEEGYITCLKIELPEATKEERLKHGM